MMAKSEIALLAITVLGTPAAGLAGQHPSFMRPIYGQPSIACSVPVSAFQAGRPSAKRKHCSIKYRGYPMRFRNGRLWKEAVSESGGVPWSGCSTV